MTNTETTELAWLRKHYRITTIMFTISNLAMAAALVFTVAVTGCDETPGAPADPVVTPAPVEPETPTPEPEPGAVARCSGRGRRPAVRTREA